MTTAEEITAWTEWIEKPMPRYVGLPGTEADAKRILAAHGKAEGQAELPLSKPPMEGNYMTQDRKSREAREAMQRIEAGPKPSPVRQVRCWACQGVGWVPWRRVSPRGTGEAEYETRCTQCAGRGVIWTNGEY